MNERILKLFTKACYHGDYEPENVPNAVVEKFAELIVKETMQVVANQLPSNQYLDIAHAVIKHFGVKE
jgi:hypothetical protein